MSKYVLAIDAGGSFLKSCIIMDNLNVITNSTQTLKMNSQGSKNEILNVYKKTIENSFDYALKEGFKIEGIAVSTPGPFNYTDNISLMEHKFQSLYGLNIKNEIYMQLKTFKPPIVFMHDVHAFIKGEYEDGAAKGYKNIMGITIGTGLGMGIIIDGKILDNGSGGPHISLFKMPYKGKILEDAISKKGISAYYKEIAKENIIREVKEIAHLADKGNIKAQKIFANTGNILGKAIKNILIDFGIECVVLGGQISKAFKFMEFSIKEQLKDIKCLKKISAANYIDYSALKGAAKYFFEVA